MEKKEQRHDGAKTICASNARKREGKSMRRRKEQERERKKEKEKEIEREGKKTVLIYFIFFHFFFFFFFGTKGSENGVAGSFCAICQKHFPKRVQKLFAKYCRKSGFA